MSARGFVGEIYSRRGELQVEWKLHDFLLSETVDDFYKSSVFDFWGRSWYLKVFPNGQTEQNSVGWIGLYLVLAESCPALEVQYTLGIKTSEGRTNQVWSRTRAFEEKGVGYGTSKAVERSELSRRRDELSPSDILTIVATLKTDVSRSMEGVLSRSLKDNICLNLKNILNSGSRSDVILKLDKRKFPAHRLILESRSSVFASMFSPEGEESKNAVVKIPDIEPDVFELVLSYIYSGDVNGVTWDKVCQVFAAADKYDLKDLKQWCVSFMEDNLSVDTICNILFVADKYEEEELKQRAKEYFVKNSAKILDTDKWDEFVSKNQALAIQILESVVKGNHSKAKK